MSDEGAAGRGNAVDLVVVGPPKSGTSSLFALLASHPDVDDAHAKEPVFFSTDRGLDLGQDDGPMRSGGFDRGPDWYDDLFRGPVDAVRLEGTTDYFASPSSASLLATAAPGVHVVVSLREPAERLVSQYWHERRTIDLPDLADLVSSGHPRLDYWLRCSRLGEGLERWVEHLPASQIHVVNFGDLISDPLPLANAVLFSLGLSELTDRVDLDTASTNAAGTSKSRRLHRLLTTSKLRRAAEDLPDWIQRPLRSAARSAMNANLERVPYPETPAATLKAIRRMLAPDRERLLALLDAHWPDQAAVVRDWPW